MLGYIGCCINERNYYRLIKSTGANSEERNGLSMEIAILNFFQQQANTKRKKKLVCKIKDDCGMWIDNPQTIADNLFMIIRTVF